MLLSRIRSRSSNSALVRIAAIVLFAALTALTARITIPLPFTPVPITLQVMIVLLAGLTLGAKDGALSQIAYIASIAVGLPFDANGLGTAAFASPTAGYLIGFVAGYLAERGLHRNRALRFFAGLAGVSVIYFIGTAWLTRLFLNGDWLKGWTLGIAPFIVIDLIKALIASATAEGARVWLNRSK
ncbi:MAG TPA: biotin transporter BioY [Anaerolineae bacterium]|nr:biotin transporter BioY [Anaerolineae bacterium]